MTHPDQQVYPGEILASRWEVGAYLGSGAFSLVYEGRELPSGRECAVKILSFTQNTPEALLEFQTEDDLLELLSSRSNVVAKLDSGRHQISAQIGNSAPFPVNVPYIVLERAEGSLADVLLLRHQVSWEERLHLFRGVVKGMHQMHLDEVANRDLKSDNILLFPDGRTTDAKVADLGRSCATRDAARFPAEDYLHGRGDLRFAAPEMLWGLGVRDPETMRLADLYLLGSVLFELATGQGITALAVGRPSIVISAVQGLSQADRERDFHSHMSDLQTHYELAYSAFQRELPPAVRDVAQRLLRRLTTVDPRQREPSNYRSASRWDLQWILRQVDIMRLTLRTTGRRAQPVRSRRRRP